MPRTRPTIIRARIFQVSRTLETVDEKSESLHRPSVRRALQRALGHEHVEGDLKVTNMMSEKRNAVSSDFQTAMRPTTTMKPAISRKLAT